MCTTMIITPGATIARTMLVTHSDDDELSDQRIVYVPAQDHPPDAQRAVLPVQGPYPRMVTDRRGPGYETPDYPPTEPIGWIPQTQPTYAYFDGNYGIMNEHNLMMGEATNAAAKYQPMEPVTAEQAEKLGEHMRIFYTSELSRIALERCITARDAITTMGQLVDQYGYYSTGETLLVADPEEAWVFEVCALPDDRYHSVWVAQRVPDGHVMVGANRFSIRGVQEDHEDFMVSDVLFKGLEAVDYWHPEDGPLDWLRAVSYGEYCHPYYSLRRIWRIYDRVNPDLALSPWVEDGYSNAFPFSIPVREPLELRQAFALYRDHYEGTEFDLTRGVAAGPYGDPHRFVGSYDGKPNAFSENENHLYGAWERPISVFYQGYTYVCQAPSTDPEGGQLGLMWLGPDVAYTTCFAPFPVLPGALLEAYQTGDPQIFDRKSAWWAFDFVGNWARLNFRQMTRADIQPLQRAYENRSFEIVETWYALVREVPWEEAVEKLVEGSRLNAEALLGAWRDLGDRLIAKYSDGYINLPNQRARDVGYPAPWLAATNYAAGPTTYRMKPT